GRSRSPSRITSQVLPQIRQSSAVKSVAATGPGPARGAGGGGAGDGLTPTSSPGGRAGCRSWNGGANALGRAVAPLSVHNRRSGAAFRRPVRGAFSTRALKDSCAPVEANAPGVGANPEGGFPRVIHSGGRPWKRGVP